MALLVGVSVENRVILGKIKILFGWIYEHISIIQAQADAVETLFSLFHHTWRLFLRSVPSRSNYFFLIIFIYSKSRAGDGELDEEDQEQNHHVEEQQNLMMPDRPDEANDRDNEEKDATCSDATNDWKARHNARHLTMNCNPYH